MKKALLAAFACTVFATVNAQSSATQTVTLNLQNQLDISIVSASGINFLFANQNHYVNGITNTNASEFRVHSNRPWSVTVKANSATFSGPTGNSMPANKLGVSIAGKNEFVQLSNVAQDFTSGARGIQSFKVDYKATPGFDYDAGTYTLEVLYTATQQ